MTKIFVVYEIKGPDGYIPYIYTKNSIDNVLMDSLKGNLSIEIFPQIEKILSRDILNGFKYTDDNIYLIPIDQQLEKHELSQILTPAFCKFVSNRNNFKIIYVDYGIPALHSLL